MSSTIRSTINDPQEFARQVQTGALGRRQLLKMFGVSAAALGLATVGQKPSFARDRKSFDYCIVGTGSAACTLAARLLADSDASVLMIEAGGSNDLEKIHDFTQAGSLTAPGSTVDWPFMSEPQPALDNRPQSFASGKVEGGSSSINGCVYVRGNPGDYDSWAEQGAKGWDYASVRPSLDALTPPIRPSDELTRRNALSQATLEAAVDLGYRYNPDYNGPTQFGVGFTQLNVLNLIRQDAFTTFVGPQLMNPRLTVMTNAQVTRLTFDRNNAIDRVIVQSDGREYTVKAEREVILSAGSVNTARLLQLSGIGDASHLKPLGIKVVNNLRGVGQNLHDHLISTVTRALLAPEPASHITAMDVNLFTGEGPFGAPQFQFQVYYSRNAYPPAPANTTSIGAANVHPTSRGTVMVRSTDPNTPPIINPNFLQTQEDLENSLEGFELSLEWMNAKRLRTWVAADNVVPGTPVTTRKEKIAALRAVSQSNFHAVGTCRMGTDPLSVVDPELRVHGISGLRVAGAAIMPSITSGNTNAPSMMIGDRAGRLILGRG
jgi:choline dehydrogenase